MDFYAETTVYILIACVGASLGLTLFCYQVLRGGPQNLSFSREGGIQGVSVLPVLIVGPIILLLGYGLMETNLLYPVRLDSTAWEAMAACLVPATILFVCSGLLVIGVRQVKGELAYWRGKAFVRVNQAMGLSVDRALRKLVVMKAATETWARCLPWVFGELIIVEVVFNAPGVGYALWNFAKMRQFDLLWQPLGLLAIMYVAMASAVFWINRWLGVKLASYC